MPYRDDLEAALERADAAERRVTALEAALERARGEAALAQPLESPRREPLAVANQLVDRWCDRRCHRALRAMLPGWPVTSGLTDDLADQLKALENVRALAADERRSDEREAVDELITTLRRMVHRR